ncbi:MULTISPECIES: YecA family protein [Salinicola]|uniref:YgfB and YecA protein n=1 Tax=Salinicola socius TaxID=404433 RepID=A0A1Q8SNN6_9GAMM|nr:MULTISPECIES: YecA family protein [Salinicola]OLO03050.1 YgfB and YecA protein [Salinicola socius]
MPDLSSESPDDAIESQPPLGDDALARLDDYLDDERLGEQAPDVIAAHGYLVALAVSPRDIEPKQWIAELFEGEPPFDSVDERDEILGLLETLKSNAGSILERGHWVELPFDTELDEAGEMAAAIEDWCAGFMQGVFLDEGAWFSQDESHVAALLLPFMALSGLFDDEPEIEEMIAEDEQFVALARQLPELTLDLYLHFRVPPEPSGGKNKGKAAGKASSGGRKRGRKR